MTGATLPVMLDEIPQPMNTTFLVAAGSTLALGTIRGAGARAYLCVRGGLDVAQYLGSRSTFTLGQFGGHGGRALRAGDVLHLHPLRIAMQARSMPDRARASPRRCARAARDLRSAWRARILQRALYRAFLDTDWEIHFNSSRTGVRLIGPKPEWARADGGEAGLHPSNIHDNPYAVGAIDFTGDMPVILGPDGPSLGGFVCPVTVIEADLWQIGQLKAGRQGALRARRCRDGAQLRQRTSREVATLAAHATPLHAEDERARLAIADRARTLANGDDRLVARLSGDTHLLLEIGPSELDLVLRFRVPCADAIARSVALAGRDRSDAGHPFAAGALSSRERLPLATLARACRARHGNACCCRRICARRRRIVHLPLSWDDPACQLAIDKYMTTVRKDAPWCPSNLEFIRRINGLDSIDDVKRIVFDASYLVMGLGDVYLGAPVATPLDPRHRLVTTKYNPARTWTPENSVGIGGAYLCVYGMEGPGGYQFVGRTVQMWNRYREDADFAGKP